MAEETRASQQFVSVEKIKDGIVYLKKGGVVRVLMVSGINFDLKSEAEQGVILASFQDFLNTLDFYVQFFVHSRKVNVDQYIEKMEKRKGEEQSELLKIQIEEYIQFIKSFVEQNDIISKSFFVVVPYESIRAVENAKGFFGLFKKTSNQSSESSGSQEMIEQLNHRVDQVIEGLWKVGLRAIPLEDDELVELFYNLYNPQLIEKKGLDVVKINKT